jgi:hypothetical protein
MQGDVLGNQVTNIEFAYLPLSFSTAEAEIQIRTSEFDSQPKTVRIVGSAAPFTGQPTDISKVDESNMMPKTLLTTNKSKNQMRGTNSKLKSLEHQNNTQQQTSGQ